MHTIPIKAVIKNHTKKIFLLGNKLQYGMTYNDVSEFKRFLTAEYLKPHTYSS